MQKYYLVHCEGRGMPSKRHFNRVDAEQEAERVCKKERKEVAVLEAVIFARPKETPVEFVKIHDGVCQFETTGEFQPPDYVKCVTTSDLYSTNPPTYKCRYCDNKWAQGYAVPNCKQPERLKQL
jgi:hypothetical protein